MILWQFINWTFEDVKIGRLLEEKDSCLWRTILEPLVSVLLHLTDWCLQHFIFNSLSLMVSQRPKKESCSQTLNKTAIIISKLLWTVVASKYFHLFSLPRTFPWFDLTAVSLRKSLFSQLLEKRELVWCHLMPGALLYQAPSGDCPTKQCGLVSTKTSLTSAVAEPSVIPDNKSPLSTAASNSFSEIPEENAEYDPKSSYTKMKPTRNALLRSHPGPFMGLSGARTST